MAPVLSREQLLDKLVADTKFRRTFLKDPVGALRTNNLALPKETMNSLGKLNARQLASMTNKFEEVAKLLRDIGKVAQGNWCS